MKVAQTVGLKPEPVRLFEDSRGSLWFGTKRFDRGPQGRRIHAHTLAGLVHADFRLPSLDYETLLHVTNVLTKSREDLLAAYRQMIFNIVFHNRDDHGKNFSFLLSEEGNWRLSPAYDLNYSRGPGGEHTTAVLGEGRAPKRTQVFELGAKFGIEKKLAESIYQEVEEGRATMKDLFRQHRVKRRAGV